MGRLIAGPWVGEFGWELFNWQGRIRYLADFYDEVIIGCRESSKYLYKDFATNFFFVDTVEHETENNLCHGFETYSVEKFKKGNYYYENPQKLAFYIDNGVPTIGNRKQKFIIYGAGITPRLSVDVFIHARKTNKCGSGDRNWSKDKWNELINLIKTKYTIASIGTVEQSMHIEGTIDLRGKPLSDIANSLHQAKCIIGPSSGPMHLASLCGTTQIVWSGHERNKYRYEELWNPHKTKVIYLGDGGWQPTVKYVYKFVKQHLLSIDDDFKI